MPSYKGSDNAKAHKHPLTERLLELTYDVEPRTGKNTRRKTRRVWA
jgi:hypothetical protein